MSLSLNLTLEYPSILSQKSNDASANNTSANNTAREKIQEK